MLPRIRLAATLLSQVGLVDGPFMPYMFIQLTKDKFAYASDPLILYCLGFCAGLWLFSRFFFFFDSGTLQHGAAVSHEN